MCSTHTSSPKRGGEEREMGCLPICQPKICGLSSDRRLPAAIDIPAHCGQLQIRKPAQTADALIISPPQLLLQDLLVPSMMVPLTIVPQVFIVTSGEQRRGRPLRRRGHSQLRIDLSAVEDRRCARAPWAVGVHGCQYAAFVLLRPGRSFVGSAGGASDAGDERVTLATPFRYAPASCTGPLPR